MRVFDRLSPLAWGAPRTETPAPRASFAAVLRASAPPTRPAPPSAIAVSDAFKSELATMAVRLKMRAADILAAMWFESRLNPAAKNRTTNAVGLIQFMPDIAADLLELPMPEKPAPPKPGAAGAEWKAYGEAVTGYRAALRQRENEAVARMEKMSAEEQLPYVEKYFMRAHHGRGIENLRDTYMAMFWPSAMGKGDAYVIARKEAPGFEHLVYAQNAGLDADKDGRITAGEAAGLVAGASWSPELRRLIAEIEARSGA